MPTTFATLDKRVLRRPLAIKTGGYYTRSTTSGGSTTTAVIASLSGISQDYVLNTPWGLCNDGDNAGEFRRASSFTGTTVTFADVFSNTVASGVEMDFYPWRPSLYTEAINSAMRKLYQKNGKIYRLINSHVITHASRKNGGNGNYYAIPRNMHRAMRLSHFGRLILRDLFDRDDSTTDPSNGWTETSGNLGISDESLYQPSLSNGAHITRALGVRNGVIQATLRGILNSGSTYCSPALTFRIREDLNGDIDTADYLVVRLLNGAVDLRKVDASSESSITTASQTTADSTDYVVKVMFRGNNIRIWVDDVELVDQDLTGLNLKYVENPRGGIRWDVGGSPSNVARVRDYYVFDGEGAAEWPDWKQDGDDTILQMPAFGNVAPSGLLYLEGRAPLTVLAADGANSLTTDTTDLVEIADTDQAYETLLTQARAELLYLVASDILPTGIPEASAQLLNLARVAEAGAFSMPGMTRPSTKMRGPYTG
jgi:hypothetical protein